MKKVMDNFNNKHNVKNKKFTLSNIIYINLS